MIAVTIFEEGRRVGFVRNYILYVPIKTVTFGSIILGYKKSNKSLHKNFYSEKFWNCIERFKILIRSVQFFFLLGFWVLFILCPESLLYSAKVSLHTVLFTHKWRLYKRGGGLQPLCTPLI